MGVEERRQYRTNALKERCRELEAEVKRLRGVVGAVQARTVCRTCYDIGYSKHEAELQWVCENCGYRWSPNVLHDALAALEE